MKPQPLKKALKHLEKAQSFQERLKEHLDEVKVYLDRANIPVTAKTKRVYMSGKRRPRR